MNLIPFLTAITVSLYINVPSLPPKPIPPVVKGKHKPTPPPAINWAELFAPREFTTDGKWELHCTAEYIDPHTIITAAHCVNDGKGMFKIRTYDREEAVAKLKYYSKKDDLAIFTVDRPSLKYAKLGPETYRGQSVQMLSSEDGMAGTYATGIVANRYLDPDYLTPQIVHTCPMVGGASGSGLYNSKGELVGINVQTLGVVSYAVDTLRVRHFIEDYYQRIELTR